MDKSLTIRDFSGGLNTAIDEALLPTNMSAELYDVDLLDSKAISRRSGYTETGEIVSVWNIEAALATQSTDNGTLYFRGETWDIDIDYIQIQQTFTAFDGRITAIEYTLDYLPTTIHDSYLRIVVNGVNKTASTVNDIPLTVGTHKVTLTEPADIQASDSVSFRLGFYISEGDPIGLAYRILGYTSGTLTSPVGTGEVVGNDLVFKVYGQTFQEAGRINDLYRTYRSAGSRNWIALAGNGVYSAADAAIAVNETVQAETLAEGTPDLLSWSGFSGGQAMEIAATTTFSVPYCTNIRVKAAGVTIAADGGTATAPTGGYVDFALSAGNHSLVAVPTLTRNTSAVKVDTPANSRSVLYVDGATYTTSTRETHSHFIRVFDDYEDGSLYVGLGKADEPSDYYISATKAGEFYIRCAGDDVYDSAGNKKASRTRAWHTFRFDFIGGEDSSSCAMYYDDTLIETRTIVFADVPSGLSYDSTVGVKVYTRSISDATAIYADDLRIDGLMVWDFGSSSSAWTLADLDGANSTATVPSTISEDFGVPPGIIDTIQYSANPAFTAFSSIAASTSTLSCATYKNKIYFGSEYDAIRSYDGATVAAVTASGAAPAAKFMAVYKTRIFAAGKASDPTLLEYTAIDRPEAWTAGGSMRVGGKDAGKDCTGLAVWSDTLWYFSPSSLHAISGASIDSNKTISDRFGCIAPRSIAVSPDALIFLSENGVRAYGNVPGLNDDDGSGFLYLSENIAPTLARINREHLDKVCGAYFNNRFYLSIPLDAETENSRTFVFKYATDSTPAAWTEYSYGVSVFCTPRGDEGGLYGSVVGEDTGTIHRLEYGFDDDGVEIEMFYRTPPLTKDGYTSIKHGRRLHVTAKATNSQDLIVNPYTDDVAPAPLLVKVTGKSAVQPIRRPMNWRGRSIGLEFTSTGSDQDLSISEATVTFVEPRVR